MTIQREGVSVTKQEDTLNQTLHNGVYKVKHSLAHGRWSTIYLASHVALSVPLAIKQFHTSQPFPESVRLELDILLRDRQQADLVPATPTFSHLAMLHPQANEVGNGCFEELLREVLFLARVQHPALPILYDYFFENDSWYLVMDYIPGVTLDTYLKSSRPLPPLEALDYALQLCNVLEYLHTQVPAIVFHALKPAHILLLPDHTLALIDFGHAHYEKERTSLHHSVASAANEDAPDRTHPRQIDVQEFYDPRTDLYSLGMLLYDMLSKERREEEYAPLPLVSPENEIPPPLHIVNPEISHVLSGMVKLATCSDSLQRFQSAHTFFLALERAFAIEERRLSPQQVVHLEQDVSKGEKTIEWPVIEQSFSLHLEHRLQLRIRLWQSGQEKPQKKRISQRLFLNDEGLKHRSVPLLARTIAQVRTEDVRIMSPIDDTASQRPSRIGTLPRQTVRHIVQTCFVIVLILFLVLVSILLYTRSKQQASPNVPERMPHIPHNNSVNTVISHTGWQVLPSLPSPEADNAAVYVTVAGRPYIYMNGGYRKSADDVGQYATDYDHSLYRYDIDAAHWEIVADSFPGLVNNAATVDENSTIFFTNGYSSDTYTVTSNLWQYQPENGVMRRIQTPIQIMPGFGSALIADQQGHLFLSQGFLKAGDPEVLAGTGWYRYDISTGQWHVLADMPVGLGYVTLAFDQSGGILLLGGATDAGQQTQSDKIYRYDIVHDSWSQEIVTLPHPISGEASCSPYPYELALIGGVDPSQSVGTTNTLLFDLRTFHSTILPTFPGGGSALGVAACDNTGHLFLARGTSDLQLATRDFWILMVQPSSTLPTPTETLVKSPLSLIPSVRRGE
jgi:serine/threonine protein kinase